MFSFSRFLSPMKILPHIPVNPLTAVIYVFSNAHVLENGPLVKHQAVPNTPMGRTVHPSGNCRPHAPYRSPHGRLPPQLRRTGSRGSRRHRQQKSHHTHRWPSRVPMQQSLQITRPGRLLAQRPATRPLPQHFCNSRRLLALRSPLPPAAQVAPVRVRGPGHRRPVPGPRRAGRSWRS